MIVLAAPLLLIGYTLVYAAVAAGGKMAYAPWLAWEKNASAWALPEPIPRGAQRAAGGGTNQPASDIVPAGSGGNV